mgnify:CR=1 FL=1|tara:strand:+ start:792 stop:1547 length:756 start_codon:yes stop_codon:yes gene_type:complete
MKSLFENWRKFNKRETLSEGEVEDYIRGQNLQTYGDLVKFMKLVRSKKRSVEGLKAIADWAADLTGQGLVSHLVNTYVRKKPTDPQDFMKLFRVDPKYAAIIDNDVEEAFVQWFMKTVDDDTSNLAQMRLDSEAFDINGVLRRWLSSAFDGRTIAKLNESLDPEVIKMIEETTQSVLEIPINKMYMNGTHITVQLNTDSREHASDFTRLVQNHWTSSSECVKLEKMGYKVHVTTLDREEELEGSSITKQLL